jgi:hypothetical protein
LAARDRLLGTALTALLLPLPACGKKGDPQPPLRRLPQSPAGLALAQRGERVVVSVRAPQAWSDGTRLPVVELELLRAEGAGEFAKLARPRRVRAAPGEVLSESEAAPPPGTRLRYAARTRAQGKQSPLSGVVSLEVQAPPPVPSALAAERAEGKVRLSWTAPAAVPVVAGPSPAPAAPAAPPAPPVPAPGPPAPEPGEPAAAVPSPSPEASPASPAPPAFWVYRRSGSGGYGTPLSQAPVPGPPFLDETPPQDEACYVVRTVVSSEPVVESGDSNEACLPATAPQPRATPGAGTTLPLGDIINGEADSI